MFQRIILLLLISLNGYSQSLSPERVARIKNSTVQIKIEGTEITGTGFFIDSTGALITCWHVISEAILFDSVKRIPVLRNIIGRLNDGREIQYGIESVAILDSNLNTKLVGYDCIVLLPTIKIKTPFLKLGSFKNLQEGDEVYTSGYPLTLQNQFLSKGIVSAKYTESKNFVTRPSGYKIMVPRDQALLDMTLNSGNSGGAIIKIANNINDDEVIGIADFIINPIAPFYNSIMSELLISAKSGSVKMMGINPVQMYALFTELFKSSSVGISGCVSIDHVKSLLTR